MEKSTKICNIVQKAIESDAIYGVSYSLQNRQGKEQHYLGKQGSRNESQDIAPDLEYDLASLTKVVGTTTRIFQLLESKQLSLTDTVGKFIAGTKYPNLPIELLLLHESGLPADIAVAGLKNQQDLIQLIKNTALIYSPGKQTIYSDLGYILLGWIIQKIDGDLAKSLVLNIFEPLEMKNTGFNLKNRSRLSFVPTENLPERGGILRGEVHDQKAHLLNGVSGHAGLFSTLSDLDNFVSMYLHNGIFQDKEILHTASFEMLRSYYQNGRTLGWQRWVPTGLKIWHTGFTGTSIAIDLDKKTGFVCLTNRVYPTRRNKKWLKWRRLAVGTFFEEPEVIKIGNNN